jgi:hypothetical protein
MCKLRINVGKMNGLTVPLLIGLINRATHGPMMKLGRIRLMDNSSVFEIAGGGNEKTLMQNLGKSNFKDRQLKCVPDSDDSRDSGPHESGSHDAGPHHAAPRTHAKPQAKVVHPAHPVHPAPPVPPVKAKKAPPAPQPNLAKSRKEKLQIELQKMESDLMARLKSL